MAARQRIALCLASFLLPAAVLAQAPPAPPPAASEPETITSDALYQKDDPTARHFVEGYLEPEGGSADYQYSRWKKPVCPHAIGLKPVAAQLVESRIRQVAAQVGAKVDKASCRPNIIVIFSDTPQAWLDALARDRWEYVAEGSLRLTIKYPVQSWYTEMLRTSSGELVWDEEHSGQGCHQTTHLNTDCTIEFGFTTAIVDTRAAGGMALTSIADYLALVTLSQTRQNGQCHGVPSIANLMVKGCPAENHVGVLSQLDFAMLSGLYHSRDDWLQVLQRTLILRSMKDVLRQDMVPAAVPASADAQSKE
jgi:hypothetical protein